MNDLVRVYVERGDLAHVALFLWASSTTGMLVWAMRELAASNRRFNDFVTELSRVSRLLSGGLR